jgi:predicted nucleic acid-binding protein
VIHLDTSFLIRALVRISPEDKKLRGWLRSGEDIGMSSIAWAEFLCGPIDQGVLELVGRFVPRRDPFTEEDAALAAQLFNQSGRRRGTMLDCMIAASAMGNEALLATANESDFVRFRASGLRLVDRDI